MPIGKRLQQHIIEIFIEEINKTHFNNILWHYQVFTGEEQQNYAWAVYTCSDGYTLSTDSSHVNERSVYLHTNNGILYFKTFSSATRFTINNIVEESNTYDDFIKSQRERIWVNFLDESNRWLKRYERQYTLEQLKLFDKFFKEYCDSTLLIIAAKGNKKDFTKLSLQQGFDVNEKTKESRNTALMVAAGNASKDVVQILLQAYADVNEKNKNGNTALIFATLGTEDIRIDIIRMLIQAGAEINVVNNSGENALTNNLYYSNPNIDLVRTLIQAGIDVNPKNGRKDILEIVIDANKKEILDILLKKKYEDSRFHNDLQTQLFIAAYYNDKEEIDKLIKKGTDINKLNFDGYTPLMAACINNSKDSFEYLLSNGADINIINIYGKTALNYAVDYNSKECVEELLGKGAKDNDSNCFFKAVNRDYIDIVNLLVNADENDIYKEVVYRNVEIRTSGKSFFYFMTSDYGALKYELQRYKCRLPVAGDLQVNTTISQDLKDVMKENNCCWAITNINWLGILYYYVPEQEPKSVYLFNLNRNEK